MLFNSFVFLCAFLPVTYAVFWLLRDVSARYIWLTITGYIFYGYWNPRFTLLMAFSTLVSYLAGLGFLKWSDARRRRLCLVVPVVTDLCLLGVFKYTNFLLESTSQAAHLLGLNINLPRLSIILPIGWRGLATKQRLEARGDGFDWGKGIVHLVTKDPHQTLPCPPFFFAQGTAEIGQDQQFVRLSPQGQGDSKTLYANQWNHKASRIGAVANGRTVKRVLIGYDNPNGPASFKGWLDDIRLTANPAQQTRQRDARRHQRSRPAREPAQHAPPRQHRPHAMPIYGQRRLSVARSSRWVARCLAARAT